MVKSGSRWVNKRISKGNFERRERLFLRISLPRDCDQSCLYRAIKSRRGQSLGKDRKAKPEPTQIRTFSSNVSR